MAKLIQIRNLPGDLHRGLKARAAMEGLSLSDYLAREVRRVAERPALAEYDSGSPNDAGYYPSRAKAVREERQRRRS